MMPRPRWVLVATILLLGCANSVEPTNPPTAAPTAAPVATASGARLVVHGSGEIECPSPYACEASIAFLPADDARATVPPTWLPEGQPRFDQVATSGPSWRIVGISSAPTSIQPGSYLIVGDVSMISDVSSGEPGDVTFPIMGTVAECVQPLNVGTTTTEVRVSIAFAHDRPCAIGLATGPEGDLGPTRTPPTSCYLLGVQICHRSVELVRRLYPTEIESAFAVVVSDTCPVGSVCDRVYATDAALAIVPQVPGTDPL